MLNLNYLPDSPDTGGWKIRHLEAVREPRDAEVAIVGAIRAWLFYAERHLARYQSPIGDDGELGRWWLVWGSALRELLNGETGRLDCSTLDHVLRSNLIEHAGSRDLDQFKLDAIE